MSLRKATINPTRRIADPAQYVPKTIGGMAKKATSAVNKNGNATRNGIQPFILGYR
jgi:hypothetical protein